MKVFHFANDILRSLQQANQQECNALNHLCPVAFSCNRNVVEYFSDSEIKGEKKN